MAQANEDLSLCIEALGFAEPEGRPAYGAAPPTSSVGLPVLSLLSPRLVHLVQSPDNPFNGACREKEFVLFNQSSSYVVNGLIQVKHLRPKSAAV